jgi:hypothetical protein
VPDNIIKIYFPELVEEMRGSRESDMTIAMKWSLYAQQQMQERLSAKSYPDEPQANRTESL